MDRLQEESLGQRTSARGGIIYTALYYYDPGSEMFIAQVPELPGCMSQGETIEEAKENIQDALEDCLLLLEDEGREIPEPHEYLMGFVTVPTARAGGRRPLPDQGGVR